MPLPVGTGSAERRDEIVRMLTASPDGLSDAALTRALGGPDAGVRTQTVNQLCRRLVVEGRLERVGTRPILNRLVPPPKPARPRRTANGTSTRATRTKAAPADPPVDVPASPPDPVAAPAPGADLSAPEPIADVPTSTPPRTRKARSTTRTRRKPTAEPSPTESEASERAEPLERPVLSKAPPPAVGPETPVAAEESEPHDAATGAAEDVPGTPATNGAAPHVPVRDALQAWSRVVNVQAAVADWLARRGATIRSATVDGQGPARDLVVSLDGDDLHVEVTGWPADGARTHPTTIAGDWFHAAEHAATERRRIHPSARIVIALPDTRRYRALTRDRAEVLGDARAEVWFVDPAGVVHAS